MFDITVTGVTGHHKSSRIPFTDRAGQHITSESSWEHSRNQQRNWETLTQLISLRTQVDITSTPINNNGMWEFEFQTETADVYGTDDDPTAVLRNDSNGVPMIVTLENQAIMAAELVVSGPDQNIWFEQITVNT